MLTYSKNKSLWRAFALGAGMSSSACYAELVVNGGFEAGHPPTGWNTFPLVPFGEPYPQFCVVGSGNAHSGQYYMRMGSYEWRFMNQLLPTIAGQDYELSFWVRVTGTYPAQMSVTWEGESVWGRSGLPAANTWFQFTVPLHATQNGSRIAFGQNQYLQHTHFDDISVVAVPGPGAASLLLIAGALSTRRRRAI